jgi:hypothetical protein
LRTTMTAIALPTQLPPHRLCHIRIGRPPPSLLPTALLILRAATATTTATTTPTVKADEGGAKLVALPCLTRRVDVAMCPFRSYVALPPLSSDKVGESTPPLSSDCIQREAMGANGGYRHALAGAASSLARSASAEVGARRRAALRQRARGGKENNCVPSFLWDVGGATTTDDDGKGAGRGGAQ